MSQPADGLPRGGLGKLPCQAEFVRALCDRAELVALERWISEGIFHATRTLGGEFADLYDQKLFHRFVFRADNGGQTVVGVIRAAQDAQFRRFPFVAFALVPTRDMDQEPRIVPMLGDVLFSDLEETIRQVASLSNLDEIKARLLRRIELPELSPSITAGYRVFLDEVTCGELPGDGPVAGPDLVRRLWTVLLDNQRDLRLLPFCLALPLSQPAFSRPLEIRFWLDLCLAALSRRPTLSFFWRAGSATRLDQEASDRPPEKDALLLAFRQPSGLLFQALLGGVRSSSVSGIWRPAQGEPLPSGLSRQTLARSSPNRSARPLLQIDDGMSLGHVLEVLSPGQTRSLPATLLSS